MAADSASESGNFLGTFFPKQRRSSRPWRTPAAFRSETETGSSFPSSSLPRPLPGTQPASCNNLTPTPYISVNFFKPSSFIKKTAGGGTFGSRHGAGAAACGGLMSPSPSRSIGASLPGSGAAWGSGSNSLHSATSAASNVSFFVKLRGLTGLGDRDLAARRSLVKDRPSSRGSRDPCLASRSRAVSSSSPCAKLQAPPRVQRPSFQ